MTTPRTILKYKSNDELRVPLSDIKAGTNVEIVRDKDDAGLDADSLTINNTSPYIPIEGTIREIKIIETTVSDVTTNTVRLEENLKLRDGKITFGDVITTIADIEDNCVFLHSVTMP
jgi:hypothetical protein|tara:strand:+ start:4460 stop:4810 length:351 start_codon:yes stop_codon:yes gene_type:complete